jgi:hypothetical protein
MDRLIYIRFERTGGFSGLRLEYAADLRHLEEDKAREIVDLVLHSGLTEKTDMNESDEKRQGMHPDSFEYRIMIETTETTTEYFFPEQEIPEEAWPLIRYLSRESRKL